MLARRDQWLDFNNAFALENAGSPEQIQPLLEQALVELRQRYCTQQMRCHCAQANYPVSIRCSF